METIVKYPGRGVEQLILLKVKAEEKIENNFRRAGLPTQHAEDFKFQKM